jgi:hypothetical protein
VLVCCDKKSLAFYHDSECGQSAAVVVLDGSVVEGTTCPHIPPHLTGRPYTSFKKLTLSTLTVDAFFRSD